MKNALPDFTEKVVVLSFPTTDGSRALAHPRWEKQGGRLFLIGAVPVGGSRNDWLKGGEAAVAWEMVSDYLVFDSLEDYHKRRSIYASHKRKA
jgi:hypothetical protein